MPSFSHSVSIPVFEAVNIPPLQWVQQGTRVATSLVWNKTNTVRRVRPADPFRNGTSFLYEEEVLKSSGGQGVAGQYIYTGPGTFFNSSAHVIDPIPSGAEFNDLASRLYGKLRGQIKDQNVNLAQSMAEYRQVCSMFGNAARDVVSAMRSVRRGSALSDIVKMFNDPRNPPSKRIANRWLEYQYGFRPLMQDLYGAAEELGKNLDSGIPRYQFCRVSEQKSGAVFESQALFKHWRNTTRTHSAQARVRYVIRRAGLKQLAQVGITNPALLAWELIPYSFVVDWLFPVGDWLSSLDALTGIEDLVMVDGWKTETVTTSKGVGSVTRVKKIKVRNPPAFHIPLPQLRYKPSKSLTAVLNGLALLRQLR